MHYRVIPSQFCVAYQAPNGEWTPVTESGSFEAVHSEAIKLNAEWAAQQAKQAKQTQRFVPPAERKPVRWVPDDRFA